MALISGKYWTGDLTVKPDAWGPVEDVQAAVRENADSIYGIDPGDIELCLPMWGPGNQFDYAQNLFCTNIADVAFKKNSLDFGAYSTNNRINLPDSDVGRMVYPKGTIFCIAKLTSVVFGEYPILWCVRDLSTTVNGFIARHDNNAIQGLTFTAGGYGITTEDNFVFTDDWAIYAATWTGTEVSIYAAKNGEVRQYVESFDKIPITSTIVPTIGNRIGGGRGLNGKMSLFFGISSAMTPSQIAYLSEYPYGLLQPITRRSYFIPDGDIGITLVGNNLNANSFMDSYQLNLIKLLDASDVLVVSNVTDSILSGLINIVQSNDVSADSLITTVSVQAIRKLIGQEISSITQITDVILSTAKQFNLTDLESLTEITNVVFSVIRKLSIDDVNISSEIVNISIDVVKSLLFNEVSSLSDVTDAVIYLSGNTTFNDPQSQTEITSVVMSVLRQLHLSDLISNTEVTNIYLQAIRQINFNDVSSISQIEALVVSTTESMGIEDLSATVNITNAILSVFKGITPINISIESDVISSAISVLRNIFSNTVNISSSINSVGMSIVGLAVTGKVSVTFSMAVPGGTFKFR